jgi:ligand-binding SRPBCC domain-containing protein
MRPTDSPTPEQLRPTIAPHPERRGGYLLTTALWLPHPREVVFEFFADAGNLEWLTPPWLHFEIRTPRPIAMRAGALIDYRLRLHGLPLKWRTEISLWEPPYQFVDQQLRGPYQLWRHLHTFESRDGGTYCTDRVEYAFWGGALVHNLLVRRDLDQIFTYRQLRLWERFGERTAAPTATGHYALSPAD